MTRAEIKEAIEFQKRFGWCGVGKYTQVLVAVAEGVLKLPEKKEPKHGADDWADGWNEYRSEAMKALNIEEEK